MSLNAQGNHHAGLHSQSLFAAAAANGRGSGISEHCTLKEHLGVMARSVGDAGDDHRAARRIRKVQPLADLAPACCVLRAASRLLPGTTMPLLESSECSTGPASSQVRMHQEHALASPRCEAAGKGVMIS